MNPQLQAQLELLRQRMAKVDAKYAGAASPVLVSPVALEGTEVETPHGKHLQREIVYPFSHHHGQYEVERLRELVGSSQVYLDTETTGLAGGAGTLAFLIGAGELTENGFVLRQWFIRDHGEEASALESLSEYLRGFSTVVTYNGKSYDQPLLETRYTLARQRTPFAALEHVDLLYAARRLWKMRFESCRLVELERQILGHERVGDVPGELIPQIYFEFLRNGNAARLEGVLQHNALDILSLAFLAAIVPPVFADPLQCSLRHGAELAGLARWLEAQNRWDEAAQLYRRAVDAQISDELLFRCLWDLGQLERRREQIEAALVIWSDLARSRNPYQADAYIELAKYYEHKEKNLFMALECTEAALERKSSAELVHRRARLARKIDTPRNRRLL